MEELENRGICPNPLSKSTDITGGFGMAFLALWFFKVQSDIPMKSSSTANLKEARWSINQTYFAKKISPHFDIFGRYEDNCREKNVAMFQSILNSTFVH